MRWCFVADIINLRAIQGIVLTNLIWKHRYFHYLSFLLLWSRKHTISLLLTKLDRYKHFRQDETDQFGCEIDKDYMVDYCKLYVNDDDCVTWFIYLCVFYLNLGSYIKELWTESKKMNLSMFPLEINVYKQI